MNDKKLKVDFMVKYPTSEDMVEISLGVEDEMKDMPINEENAVQYVKSIKSLIHNMITVSIHDTAWPALDGICSSKEEQGKNGQESRKEPWRVTVILADGNFWVRDFIDKPDIEWTGSADSLALVVVGPGINAGFRANHVVSFIVDKKE